MNCTCTCPEAPWWAYVFVIVALFLTAAFSRGEGDMAGLNALIVLGGIAFAVGEKNGAHAILWNLTGAGITAVFFILIARNAIFKHRRRQALKGVTCTS
jgi:hypothetical protein